MSPLLKHRRTVWPMSRPSVGRVYPRGRRRPVLAADRRADYDASDSPHRGHRPAPGLGEVVGAARRVLDAGAGAGGGEVEAVRAEIARWERLGGIAAVGLAEALGRLAELGGVDEDGASSTAEWVKANRVPGRDD